MELLDPSGGGDGLAYGVVGTRGAAKIDIYRGTVESFDRGELLATATAQGGQWCRVLHHRAARVGVRLPITWSQGIWAIPPGQFPGGLGRGGGRLRRLAAVGGAISTCDPPTSSASSGVSAGEIISTASQVASGTIDGHHPWSLWAKHGEKGSAALEDAGLALDSRAYGLCPGFPSPAELEIVNPGAGSNGIVFGVVGYNGAATIKVSVGTLNTFSAGKLRLSQPGQPVDGTTFSLGELPPSACSYPSSELDVQAGHSSSQHNLGFDLHPRQARPKHRQHGRACPALGSRTGSRRWFAADATMPSAHIYRPVPAERGRELVPSRVR